MTEDSNTPPELDAPPHEPNPCRRLYGPGPVGRDPWAGRVARAST